jgi:hypothetical protein
MLGRIATAAATVYGYKTIGGLITANSGLIIVLIAFIFVSLVFRRLLNRQFPRAGRQPAKMWIFKAITVFMIASFVFICGFTVFYEKKKMETSYYQPSINQSLLSLNQAGNSRQSILHS